ncbi:MAG: peptide chain release factor N(5)-glutamine methyltransferase [Draconibacterium sp.]|nr:peptide chain release factor N(5)-glutamine methyltransferase [Draconibacterium sp.]
MRATIQYIEKELAEMYPKTEVQGFEHFIFESVCGWNYTSQVLMKNKKISSLEIQKIEAIVRRLKMYEPLQYILGETEFYGLNLKVTPAVLIPRPETEELVHWIIESNAFGSPQVLDIGTGSGCIALALKKQIKNAEVSGVDISKEALEVAKQNAENNKLEVGFFQSDILSWEHYNWKVFDIIVSNPPYVREIEKQKMQANVLEYEPENALFVSDENPLVFYHRIAEFAKKYLVDRGKLFFEINEFLGAETCKLLENKGFVDVELKKDMNGKTRMLACRKKNNH